MEHSELSAMPQMFRIVRLSPSFRHKGIFKSLNLDRRFDPFASGIVEPVFKSRGINVLAIAEKPLQSPKT
ncbi:hypothetical protein VP96_01299 [Vibrio cholerae]|nr:hypothetical protein ASZ85_03645 [Vibrio cholerae]KKP11870.1 hypothetical protein VS84_01860 [Vibrio cholerae]KKP12740.1 hypothetical protein VP96_01299 [Vibrio cholerae]KKP20146.1 hypothetical protein VS86_02016 [Vibrio cholerae]